MLACDSWSVIAGLLAAWLWLLLAADSCSKLSAGCAHCFLRQSRQPIVEFSNYKQNKYCNHERRFEQSSGLASLKIQHAYLSRGV